MEAADKKFPPSREDDLSSSLLQVSYPTCGVELRLVQDRGPLRI